MTDTSSKSTSALTVRQMEERLRLTTRLAKKIKLRRVTDAEAREELGFGTSTSGRGTLDLSGIAFPGYDLFGNKRGTYQVRRDNPEIVRGKEQNKWMSAKSKGDRYLNTTPGSLRPGDTVIRVESPKSTLAVAAWAERTGRKNIKVIDTNGLDGYLVHDDSKANDPSHPNPELALLADHDVVDCPDSNAKRSDLCSKVERFQSHLLSSAVNVRSLRTMRIPPQVGGKDVNGPDDLLALGDGDELFTRYFDEARPAWKEAIPPVSDFAGMELKADLLIPHIIADHAITIVAAPSESYKSVFAMQVCYSLLTGRAFGGHFTVEKTVDTVVYCCPDMSFELTLKYARAIGLDNEELKGRFCVRTMKQGALLGPDHPLVKAAARDGAYLVLDTLNYFIEADNDALVLNVFATKVRHLIDECGSPGAMVLAHPTKSGVRNSDIEVTEYVAGMYSKIGVVDTIFCLKKIPLSAEHPRIPYAVYATREKSRPFLGVALDPFTLDTTKVSEGLFPVLSKPGSAPAARDLFPRSKRGGHPPDPQKDEKKHWLKGHLVQQAGKARLTGAEVARRLNSAFHSTHDSKTIGGWMKEIVQEDKLVEQIQGP